jgi:N-acetylglucosaminyl-diphospho-decaprenol L-rhamnosyltransferase
VVDGTSTTLERAAGCGLDELGIIVVTHNHAGDVQRCLDSIECAAPGWHIDVIVRDCGSADGSVEVASHHPLSPQVVTGENIGFGAAVNESVDRFGSHVKHVLVLNPDAELVSSLEEILLNASAVGKYGCLGIRQLSPTGATVWSWDRFPGVRLEWLKALRRPLFQRSPDGYLANHRADWVMGSFLLVPRAVFQEVGGFDRRFFLFYEEVDLCRRIAERGYPVWHVNTPYYSHQRAGKDTPWREVSKLNSRRVYNKIWLTRSESLLCRIALSVRWLWDLVAPARPTDRVYAPLRLAATWNLLHAEIVDGRKVLRWTGRAHHVRQESHSDVGSTRR